jgi:N utilization substance protein B
MLFLSSYAPKYNTAYRSRERVVQALYQYMVSGGEVLKIEQQFLNQKSGKISKAFFSNLFLNILKNRTELDALIAPTISREADELGTVEQAVLYLGAYELKNSIEVPYKVVINEALEIAKLYGAEFSILRHLIAYIDIVPAPHALWIDAWEL